MEINTLVFDKDGTLIDTASFWKNFSLGVAKDILKENSQENNDELLSELMRHVGFDENGNIIPESIVVSGTSVDIINGWLKIFEANGINVTFDELYLRFERDYRYGAVVPLYDGIKEIFTHYRQKGFKIALATSDNFDSTKNCCERLGIAKLIDVIASKDKVKRPKPYPDSMDYICEYLNVLPENTAMIGDSANDMVFASNCGALPIFLKNTDNTPEKAKHHIKDIKELLKII